MTIRSERTPSLPSIPTEEEAKDPSLLLKWIRAFLTVFKNHAADTHIDFERFENLSVYADNAAAIAGGLMVGDFYRTNSDPDTVCVVH